MHMRRFSPSDGYLTMESLEGSGRVMGGQQSLLLKHDQVLPLLVGARSKVESDHHRCVASSPPPEWPFAVQMVQY